MKRRPTRGERRQERTFVCTVLVDSVMTAIFLIAAFSTGSLTMLSETVRAGLLLGLQLYSFWLLYRLHRGGFVQFEYGVTRIENLFWLLLGSGFLLGAFWMAERVFAAFSSGAAVATGGLALAAIVNAVGLTINYLALRVLRGADPHDESNVFEAQVSARGHMVLASAVVQVTLTAAILAKDTLIATGFDMLGALMLVCFMVFRGITMFRHGMPVLLDAPAEASRLADLSDAASETFPVGSVASIRTRRSGSSTSAEIGVLGDAFTSTGEIFACSRAMEENLKQRDLPIDLCVVVVPSRIQEDYARPDASAE